MQIKPFSKLYSLNYNMEEKKVNIFRKPKGQIVISGKVFLADLEGNEIPHGDRFTLCGCGKSKRLPFCDSSHNE